MPNDVVLAMRGISKRFGATRALDDVSLELRRGEVHALVGENGAGKSTLIKVMTGVHQPDEGQVLVDGTPATPRNAADAQRLGIAAIYQEPLIFPDLSVAENIFVGHRDLGRVVRWRKMCADAEALLSRLDVHLDPRMPAVGLPVAAQQAIEIAKAISLDVRVLIMDEPTAALSAHEVERLFRQVRQLRDEGVAVLFISHRLEEVFAIADRISVFRDGRHISTHARADVTTAGLIAAMVGREAADFYARSDHRTGEVVLRVRDLGRTGMFSGVTFDVRRGEVLGLAGLVGAGRTDVALALFGIAPAETGTIELGGRQVEIGHPRQAMDLGIAYVSEDRRHVGSVAVAVGDGQHHAAGAGPVRVAARPGRPPRRAGDVRAVPRAARHPHRRAERSPSACSPAATSRRRCSPSGSTPSPRSSSSTSRPGASTWGPRPRSTTSSTSWPARAWPWCSSRRTCPRCWP